MAGFPFNTIGGGRVSSYGGGMPSVSVRTLGGQPRSNSPGLGGSFGGLGIPGLGSFGGFLPGGASGFGGGGGAGWGSQALEPGATISCDKCGRKSTVLAIETMTVIKLARKAG
mgnify:CR=1 FL=1